MRFLKETFIFLAGGLVGGAVTYYFANKKLKEVYEKKCQHDIDESLDILKKEKPVTNFIKERKEDERKTKEENSKQYKPDPRDLEEYSSLTSLYKPKDKEEEDLDIPDWAKYDGPVEKPNEHKGYTPPYIIEEEEHFEMQPHYDMVECTWDASVGQLYDDTGELIDDVDMVVGLDNLDKLLDSPNGEIIVRNDYLSLDYDIYIKEIK